MSAYRLPVADVRALADGANEIAYQEEARIFDTSAGRGFSPELWAYARGVEDALRFLVGDRSAGVFASFVVRGVDDAGDLSELAERFERAAVSS